MSVAVEEVPCTGQDAEVFDVGGEIGALVVRMPRDLLGAEIEVVSPRDRVGRPRRHGTVAERSVEGRTGPSLVLPRLLEGDYLVVRKRDDTVRLRVVVRGGEVTTAVWPA